jgi:mRNA-degrading endonuclease toxin of MazEF toxin-antitoxin module
VKNFDKWNSMKKKIDKYYSRAPVKLGEIYWCHFGINVGVEQNGSEDKFQRPVIVLRKFSNKLVLIVPLTTKIHEGSWYFNLRINNRNQQAILSQIKPIDTKRLYISFGQIPMNQVKNIISRYKRLISVN